MFPALIESLSQVSGVFVLLRQIETNVRHGVTGLADCNNSGQEYFAICFVHNQQVGQLLRFSSTPKMITSRIRKAMQAKKK